MSAPAEGTPGIGVGVWHHPINTGSRPASFESRVWFRNEDRAEAEAFAAEHGYALKDGVPL
jgi:hypothetical protein